jgi:hypothetical protein
LKVNGEEWNTLLQVADIAFFLHGRKN